MCQMRRIHFLYLLMRNRKVQESLCSKSFTSKRLRKTIKQNQQRYIMYET